MWVLWLGVGAWVKYVGGVGLGVKWGVKYVSAVNGCG